MTVVTSDASNALRQAALGFDLKRLDAAFLADPFPIYRALREHDPVHWHPWNWSGGGFWAVTKYADVHAFAKNHETFSSAKGHIYLWELDEEALEVRRSLIETDPPDHSRLRRIVSSAFTPRKVKDYEEYTRQITNELLDQVQEEGTFDVVDTISAPLPINVTNDTSSSIPTMRATSSSRPTNDVSCTGKFPLNASSDANGANSRSRRGCATISGSVRTVCIV